MKNERTFFLAGDECENFDFADVREKERDISLGFLLTPVEDGKLLWMAEPENFGSYRLDCSFSRQFMTSVLDVFGD